MKDNVGLIWKQIIWVSVFSRRNWLSVRQGGKREKKKKKPPHK